MHTVLYLYNFANTRPQAFLKEIKFKQGPLESRKTWNLSVANLDQPKAGSYGGSAGSAGCAFGLEFGNHPGADFGLLCDHVL